MITHTEVRDLIGAELLDSSGDEVGEIDQIYLDDRTGEPEWATVNTGTHESFVPLAQADRAGHAVRVPYEKSTIKDAPTMPTVDARLDEAQMRELYVYYGLDFAGQRSDSGIPSGQASAIQPGEGTKAQHGYAGRGTTGRTTGDAMTRSEEQVGTGTEKVTAGNARLRMWVETEVTLTEARPVAKEGVPVERIKLTKETVQDLDRLSEQVRQERKEAEGDADLSAGQRHRTR